MSADSKRKTIAEVHATEPPNDVRTLAEWEAWRRQENARMAAEVADQLLAWIELQGGATRH